MAARSPGPVVDELQPCLHFLLIPDLGTQGDVIIKHVDNPVDLLTIQVGAAQTLHAPDQDDC
jgi:hypothetical protein